MHIAVIDHYYFCYRIYLCGSIAITWRSTWKRTTIKNRSSVRFATEVTVRRPRSRRTCRTIINGLRNGPTRHRYPAPPTSASSARRYSANPTSSRSVPVKRTYSSRPLFSTLMTCPHPPTTCTPTPNIPLCDYCTWTADTRSLNPFIPVCDFRNTFPLHLYHLIVTVSQ